MLADILGAMEAHAAASRRAAGAPPPKFDPWAWLVATVTASKGPGAAWRGSGRGSWARELAPPTGAARFDFLPGLLAAQAPTVRSKYDVATAVLDGDWVPLFAADPLEMASGAAGALVHSVQSGAAAAMGGAPGGPAQGAAAGKPEESAAAAGGEAALAYNRAG